MSNTKLASRIATQILIDLGYETTHKWTDPKVWLDIKHRLDKLEALENKKESHESGTTARH